MTWETQRAFKTKLMTWEILRAFLTKYGMKTQCAFITKPVTWKLQGLSSLNMAWKLKTAFLIKHGTKTLRPSSLRTTRATFTQVSASTTGSFDTHTQALVFENNNNQGSGKEPGSESTTTLWPRHWTPPPKKNVRAWDQGEGRGGQCPN